MLDSRTDPGGEAGSRLPRGQPLLLGYLGYSRGQLLCLTVWPCFSVKVVETVTLITC